MSNPCPQCGAIEEWDAYFNDDENAWFLWCRECEFEEHEDDHVQRLVEQGDDV